MAVFNVENTTWQEGKYPLFLGQAPGLYDSVHVTYPKLFSLYKLQKSIDWSETEVDLEDSRVDMTICPPEAKDLMIKNLALQWEADSIASRAIAPLFAPFITNSEYWALITKISEIENLHSLTYSEIVRQCFVDPKEIFEEIMKNDNITGRLSTIGKVFNELQIASAKYTLGELTNEEAYPSVMNAVVALFCLERLQFMASFAATFGVVEDTQCFQGIGMLVAKIMQDERWVHAEAGKEVIKIELATERGAQWRVQYSDVIRNMVDEVRNAEYTWSAYLFSEGRRVGSGFNKTLLNEWVDYNAIDVYDTLLIPHDIAIKENPLKYMESWLYLDKIQNANQESDAVNYVLNSVIDDVPDDYIFE